VSLRWRIGLHCGDDFLPVPSTAQCLVVKRLSLLCMVPARIKQAKEPKAAEKEGGGGNAESGAWPHPVQLPQIHCGESGVGPGRAKPTFPPRRPGARDGSSTRLGTASSLT